MLQTAMHAAPDLFSYRKHWAYKFGAAPELPISRAEMDLLGWDSCDIVIVTGDAYVDHPSFGMAIIGRLLEAQGFRVGLIVQPDWTSADDFRRLGKPNLFFGITAGNMDSMVNRYTADRRARSDDAYTPNAEPGRRPDRSVNVYAQRAREAYKGVPIVIGGIEASLRRIAHFDYWSETVRRSVLVDSKADLLIYGNAERALVELSHRLARGEPIDTIRDLRGTAFVRRGPPPRAGQCSTRPSSTRPDRSSSTTIPMRTTRAASSGPRACRSSFRRIARRARQDRDPAAVLRTGARRPGALCPCLARVPSGDQSGQRPRPGPGPWRARGLAQPAADSVDQLGTRSAARTALHPPSAFELWRGAAAGLGDDPPLGHHPARLFRRLYLLLDHRARGAHHPEPLRDSILREIGEVRDRAPGFTGTISDLGGPSANMWRLGCRDPRIEAACRKLSCVYPDICRNLNTDHGPLIQLYRKARAVPGIKRCSSPRDCATTWPCARRPISASWSRTMSAAI
jgi:hypothetical protein